MTHRLSSLLLLILCAATLSAQDCPQLAVARRFLGRPYVAGTLEVYAPDERLVVDTLHVDCTTFVDQVLALTLANQVGEGSDATFRALLTLLRYHDGVIDGYASRCHYFTDLAHNMARRGLIAPVRSRGMAERTLTLNFMSTHPASYVQLKDDPAEQARIRAAERPFRSVHQCYFPKADTTFYRRSTSPIRDGDVVALVTTVSGLDVSHLGFAVWVGDDLHLLNASQRQGRVVLDDQPLQSYLLSRRTALGIEVWRPQFPGRAGCSSCSGASSCSGNSGCSGNSSCSGVSGNSGVSGVSGNS